MKPQRGFTCSDAAIHPRITIEVSWMDCFAEPVIGRAFGATLARNDVRMIPLNIIPR